MRVDPSRDGLSRSSPGGGAAAEAGENFELEEHFALGLCLRLTSVSLSCLIFSLFLCSPLCRHDCGGGACAAAAAAVPHGVQHYPHTRPHALHV